MINNFNKKPRLYTAIILLVAFITLGSLSGCGSASTSKSKSNSNSDALAAPKDNEKSEDKQIANDNSPKTSSTVQPTVKSAEKNTSNQTNNSTAKVGTQENQSQETFFGQWVIKRQVAFGAVGTLSSDDIKAMIGKQLTFSKDKANCFNDSIDDLKNVMPNPVYKKSVVSKSDLQTNYKVTFDQLGLSGQSVTQVEASDSKGSSCTFLIKDSNTLILCGGGVFMELSKG